MKKTIISLAIFLMIILVGCQPIEKNNDNFQLDPSKNIDSDYIPLDDREVKVDDKGENYIVERSKIKGGGPPKDGIPSIDNPSFISVEEANEWILDRALVLALDYKGVSRVYPLQVMTWHEIVNDIIAGDPILITYCPLCGSGIAFERSIDINNIKKTVEFGTSGKLYNSNLVMYDRETDTYWSQIGGNAIYGKLSGQKLNPISLETVEWGTWKKSHPDSEVLSKDTGYINRDYTNADGPYSNYFANDFLFYSEVQNKDSSRKLSNKEFVYGITIDGKQKAYAKKDVEKLKIINDTFNNVNIQIQQKEDGSVKITNTDTNKEIIKEVDFWFAWFAFHPTTELYEEQ